MDVISRYGISFDRSSMKRWRQRKVDDRFWVLLQEGLAVAAEIDAVDVRDRISPTNACR